MAVTWEKLIYQSQLDAWTGSANLVTVGDLVLGGANKRITFGTNLYIQGGADVYNFYINSALKAWLNATELGVQTTSGLRLYSTNRRITFDANDYIQYASDVYNFYIGGAQKACIDTNGMTVNNYINAGSGYKVNGTQVYQFTPGMWTNANWEDRQSDDVAWTTLDLSTTFNIPGGVKAVSVILSFMDDNLGGNYYVALSKGGAGAAGNEYVLAQGQVAGVWNTVCGTIECDTNGDIDYFVAVSEAGTTGNIYLRITGYWI